MPYSMNHYGDWRSQVQCWLDMLGTSAISQRQLANAWREISVADDVPGVGSTCWVEGGPRTVVDSVRESSPGVTVVMALAAITVLMKLASIPMF